MILSVFARRLPVLRARLAVPLSRRVLPLSTVANGPVSGKAPATSESVVDAVGAVDVAPSIPETKVTGTVQSKAFQAETKQLLDIVANSLYTDKEVFIRELVSNASDALEKCRLMRLQSDSMSGDDRPLGIMISGDEAAGTITIVDNGIGMSYDELVTNLGTIAKSGSKDFMENLKTSAEASSIIGKFGVGFYASFMVADKVEVFSRSSADPSSPAHYWASDGTGTYDIAEAEGVPSGTKVVLHLKADCRRFAKDSDIKRIVAKHSISIGFPIQVNGATQTAVGAIWLRNRNDVSEQEYVDFYKQTANAYEKPFDTLHFATDVPLSLNALLYFPKRHTEKFGMGKEKPSVNLLSRKVTIQAGSPHLLPDWLRFMKGVVDSADIPLNISRESMQNSALIRRINNVITQRILRHLSDMAKQEPARYNEFYEEFGQFLKEGVCSDDQNRTKIASLLRFSSSSFDHLTSLDEYVSRMPADQKHIYYFFNPSRELALSSPYYESFKERGTEVLFLYREVDDFVMQNLRRHADRPFMSIESAHLENKKDTAHDDKTDESNSAENVIKEGMPAYMQSVLGKRVSSVSVSKRLVSSPAILIDHENAAVRRMMKMVEGGKTMVDSLGKQKMEINLSHSIIKGIFAMRDSNPELASQLVEQVFDNALVAAGLMDDPRLMLTRINRLMESCLASSTAIPQTEQTTVSTPEAESTIETAKSASQ